MIWGVGVAFILNSFECFCIYFICFILSALYSLCLPTLAGMMSLNRPLLGPGLMLTLLSFLINSCESYVSSIVVFELNCFLDGLELGSRKFYEPIDPFVIWANWSFIGVGFSNAVAPPVMIYF